MTCTSHLTNQGPPGVVDIIIIIYSLLGKTSFQKTRFLLGIARKGGGLPMPDFFGPFFIK